MEATAVRPGRPGLARRTTRAQWRGLALITLALVVTGALHSWAAGGPRLAATGLHASAVSPVGQPTIFTDELVATGGSVTIESVRLAHATPGVDVTFEVAQGPCGWTAGATALDGSCAPRPAVGARIGPEAPVVLAVTYTSTVEHPVVAGDIVIDYRAGRRRLSIGLDTSICVRPSPVPDMVCPELR